MYIYTSMHTHTHHVWPKKMKHQHTPRSTWNELLDSAGGSSQWDDTLDFDEDQGTGFTCSYEPWEPWELPSCAIKYYKWISETEYHPYHQGIIGSFRIRLIIYDPIMP